MLQNRPSLKIPVHPCTRRQTRHTTRPQNIKHFEIDPTLFNMQSIGNFNRRESK